MDNKDRLINITVEKLGLSRVKVSEVIESQLSMVADAIKKKKPVSVYLRKVGTFVSPEVRYMLIGKSYDTKNANSARNKKQQSEDEPYEFK